MGARNAKAEAAYEDSNKAFIDESHEPTDPRTPNGEAGGEHQAADEPRQSPSDPRIIGRANETNVVGVNQQEKHNRVCSEKYGFYTVVNDAYFDSGPRVSTLNVSSLGAERQGAESEH